MAAMVPCIFSMVCCSKNVTFVCIYMCVHLCNENYRPVCIHRQVRINEPKIYIYGFFQNEAVGIGMVDEEEIEEAPRSGLRMELWLLECCSVMYAYLCFCMWVFVFVVLCVNFIFYYSSVLRLPIACYI